MSEQAHIARRLMTSWREGQGKRAAKGVPELMRALEFIAQQIADGEAWKPDPQPVSLTRKQVRLAWFRAISQKRRAEYGPPGKSADEWWDQIKSIADRWGVETHRAEWETTNSGQPVTQSEAA